MDTSIMSSSSSSSSSSSAGGNNDAALMMDDALQRLVHAMTGRDDSIATSLARQLLTIGGSTASASNEEEVLASTWRRIARKAPDDNFLAEMEALYARLEQQQQQHSSSSSPHYLPPKILTVLTKMMGERMVLPETAASAASRRGGSARTTPPEQPSPRVVQQRVPPTPESASEGRRSSRSTSSVTGHSATPRMGTTSMAARTPSAHRSFQQPPPASTTRSSSSARTSSQQQTNKNHHRPLKPKQPQMPRPAVAAAAAPQDPQSVGQEKQELEKEEALLLRECLYSLQGIDGERIRYYHKDEKHNRENQRDAANDDNTNLTFYDGIRIQSPALSNNLLYTGRVLQTRLGTGAMDALRISGEAGWLYHRIQNYIHEVQHDDSKGVVARAVAGTLGDELREYHSLLAQYESQLANHLSLRQLMVDLRMPTSRLQILALLTDGLRHLSGGHLLSGLHQHALHGDTRHATLAQSILVAASRPWFDILFTWTTQGVLSDPHGEFFVTESSTVDDRHLWNEKYRIDKDQIPEGILDKELVGPIFNVGKGINFIRRCLLDSQWTMHLESNGEDDTVTTNGGGGFQQELGYSYTPYADGNPTLQRTLSRAAHLVHTHILRTLKEENHLMQHLFALKQFLFLGQGDFFSALMDGLHSEFREQPGIVGIYKHSLLSIVEGALRSTNAKYMPQYVLDRLQVELLMDPDDDVYGMFGQDPRQPQGKGDTRTVWDIFMLDYQVPDPLRAVVHPETLDKYKMVFSLLFSLKRVEFMLNFTWRQSATLQHALQTYGQYNGINASSSEAYAQAFSLLRNISILRQNMMHLIVNLKSYFMFEVLEGGWRRLQAEIEAAKTLDEVIAAHDFYIDGIMRKSLLRTGDNDDIIQQQLADHVQILLQVTGEFCDLQEHLFHESLSMAEIATQKRMEADRRANEGRWGFDSEQEIREEENFFGLADETKMLEVTRMSTIYNQNTLALLRVLSDRVNANPDDFDDEKDLADIDDPEQYGMAQRRSYRRVVEDNLDSQRFLIAQLDHNLYYTSQGYLR
jgi:hypothetical protein